MTASLKDEKFLNRIRGMQPVLLGFSLLSLALSLGAPVWVADWVENRGLRTLLEPSDKAQSFFENLKTSTPLEKKLARLVVDDMRVRKIEYQYFKIILAVLLSLPLFVLGAAGLNGYRIRRRFLKIISTGSKDAS